MNEVVVWGVSQKQARKALLHSALHPGSTFEFRKHRENTDGTITMRCTSCDRANVQRRKFGEERLQRAHHKITSFEEGARWLTDPELNHSCIDSEDIDITTEKALGRQIYLAEQDQLIRMKFPSKRTAKKTYQNSSRKAYPTATVSAENPRAIPERFKNAIYSLPPMLGEGHNPWLLFNEEHAMRPKLLIFADVNGLYNLWNSGCIIMDGNFKFAPPGFQQIYSFVSVYDELPHRSEGIHSGFALMQKKTVDEYIRVFRTLREEMARRFGDRTSPFRFRIDCEKPALDALRTVFPSAETRLCKFHVSQAIRKKAVKKGLTDLLRANSDISKLIKGICGSVHLPIGLQTSYIRFKLNEIEEDEAYAQNPNVMSFLQYIRSYWMPLVPHINQFDIEGPATTNHAEGYHRRFQELFPARHPLLNAALFHLQHLAMESSAESLQIHSGARQIYKRRPHDIRKSQLAHQAMLSLRAYLADSPDDYSSQANRFCRYQSYLCLPKRRLILVNAVIQEFHNFVEDQDIQESHGTESDASDATEELGDQSTDEMANDSGFESEENM
ncbi:hypothetical protein QR680_003407 [Steinernema hermaphroditum]|uniref:MULE transposase domain-containing protein n=1 Tax=Steinernema hermaphroditum TaxID=289476 RepID=A0AA39H8H4_9BILA|nr:hypothetical protein QR680_003407 [Steinernema hermaphroditum]